MPDRLQPYKNIGSALIERDKDLKGVVMPAMDKMGNNEWERPSPELKAMTWLVDRIDSAPRNAEIAGVRSYSTLWPNLSIVKPGSEKSDIARYNRIENMLGYHYMLASGRPNQDMWMFGSTPTEKIIRSAERYGEVAVQVVHVDAQLGYMGNVKENRKRAIKQYGDFAVYVHNPQNVHVRASGLALEGVLLKRYQTLAEFVAFWGDRAKPLTKTLKGDGQEDKLMVCSYDYTDYDIRAVWASVTDATPSYGVFGSNIDGTEIMFEEHDLPFLPWAWRGGVEPLNYAVYKTGAWDAANVAETLAFSEDIFYAAAPRMKKSGPKPDSIIIDYTTPGNPANVPPGHEIDDMNPPQVNESHVMMGDRARGDVKGMTVPGVVTSLDSAANEAYATFDQRLKSGLSAYEPYKQMAERVHEEVFCHMLYWAKYLDKPISSPYMKRGRNGVRSFSYGKNGEAFEIKPNEYDYDIKVSVNLKAEQPLDDQQRITAAVNAVQYLGWPAARANEHIGENDPEELEKEKAEELLRQTAIQGEALKMNAQSQVEAQAITAGLADIIPYALDPVIGPQIKQLLDAVVGQIQDNQQAQAQAPQGQEPLPNPENTQGMLGVEGQGFNAAQGGQPAATANPKANTRENQTGKNRKQK